MAHQQAAWSADCRPSVRRPPTQVRHRAMPCSAQVKCSVLMLDLPGAEELVCELFSTLLDAIK